jgi:micrococcal nuclease
LENVRVFFKTRLFLKRHLGRPVAIWPSLSFLFVALFLALSAPHGQTEIFTAQVSEVMDGDTVHLSDGQKVRYIGINTPEIHKRVNGEWVHDPQPWSEEALRWNKKWTEGKTLRLEFDPDARHDRHGRLLAYVFADDLFVNKEMIRLGLAKVYIVKPHTKYYRTFKDAEAEAKQHKRGIWSGR